MPFEEVATDDKYDGYIMEKSFIKNKIRKACSRRETTS